MALQSNTTSEYEYYSGNIGGLGLINVSMCAWVNITTAGADDGVIGISHTTNGRHVALAFNGAGSLGLSTNATTTAFGSQPSTSTWIWVGLNSPNSAGGTLQAYWRAATSSTFNSVTQTNDTEGSVQADKTMAFLKVYSELTNNLQGSLAAWKVWSAVLTNTELQNESWQYVPNVYTSLWMFRPMLTAEAGMDWSGLKHTTTAAGTLTIVDGPPIPWRQRRQGFSQPTGAVAAAAISSSYNVVPPMVGGKPMAANRFLLSQTWGSPGNAGRGYGNRRRRLLT